jgi:hypothetical protein
MHRLFAYAAALVLVAGPAANEALARDGAGLRVGSGFRTVRPGHHGWRGHRPFAPSLYLDREAPAVTFVVRQTVVMAPPAFGAVPSVLDLPVAMGIREARPDQPAVYVLNERAAPVGGRTRGPKIVELDPDATGAAASEQQGSGARIIHLAVPVGTAP